MSTAEENDSQIAATLLAKTDSDYKLAGALFENYVNGYFRLLGFRSVPEYLRERFRGQEQDSAARHHARAFQRLVREFKLAREIPRLRSEFDKISRSNRRLIAQVITPDNADLWIDRALTLTYRELEELIVQVPSEKRDDGLVTKKLRLYPGQLEIFERALQVAAALIEAEGADPNGPDGPKLEMVCQEFIATYGEVDGFKAFSTAECPACGHFVALNRRPEEDTPDGTRKRIAFGCARCGAAVALAALPRPAVPASGPAPARDPASPAGAPA